MRRYWIEASGWQRGNFRRELAKVGIDFTETKGWWTSVFVFKNRDDYWAIRCQLREQGFLK